MTDETDTEARQTQLPPYIALASLKTALGVFKDQKLIPNRIDRSVWGSKFSGSATTQMLTAFRFLGLINQAGVPQPRIRKLVEALNTQAWGAALKEVILDAYASIFTLDLEKASSSEFNEKFRATYGAEGETGRKCTTFFLHAAKEASIPVSPYLLSNAKPRATSTPKKKPKKTGDAGTVENAGGGAKPGVIPPASPNTGSPVQTLMDMIDMEAMDEDEQEAVWKLVKYLKRREVERRAATKSDA